MGATNFKMRLDEKFYLSENNVPFKEFFNFGMSVDCVLFGYKNGEVRVLLIERGADPFKHFWALPGDLVTADLTLEDAASNVLYRLTGLENIFMEQFQAFSEVQRHPVGRVITVGYYALVRSENHKPVASAWATESKWFNINKLPELAFDHKSILDLAISTLKRKVRNEPIGFELLPPKFTLLELQKLYEALLGYKFDKPNFRKKLLSMNLLIPLDEVQTNVSHRPAKLFKFDPARYKTLKEEGFHFDLQ